MINNKEKNNFKNAKILLFTGLIAAMILPFSGMNYAEAKPNPEKQLELDMKKIANQLHAKYVQVDALQHTLEVLMESNADEQVIRKCSNQARCKI